MEAQRNRARAARQDVDSMQVQSEVLAKLMKQVNLSATIQLTVTSKVTSIIHRRMH